MRANIGENVTNDGSDDGATRRPMLVENARSDASRLNGFQFLWCDRAMGCSGLVWVLSALAPASIACARGRAAMSPHAACKMASTVAVLRRWSSLRRSAETC